jgi:hypothetical protein
MSKARDLANAADALDDVSATELGHLDGVTSAIQTQLDTKTAKSTLTTTGDIYYASAANTPARLGIGSTSDVLTVVAGVPGWVAPNTGVNKNYLINGGFAVAQRGTSFTSGANDDDAYTLDRWYILSDTNDVVDVTQETTTVPTNGEFAIALDVETTNKKFGIATIIENKDVIGLVGNTVTFSFKAKVSATTKLDNVKAAIVAWSGTADTVTSDIISAWGAEDTNPTLIANATYENTPANLNLTTSYATYSITAAVDTASTQNLILFIWSDVTDTTAGDFLYIAESKLELGSTATAFEYAGGTFQGELAACQRYYYRLTSGAAYTTLIPIGITTSTTACGAIIRHPVRMRAVNSFEFSTIFIAQRVTTSADAIVTSATLGEANTDITEVVFTVASGLTIRNFATVKSNNSAAAFIALNGEL